ncbi:MAG: hypothetical protein Tsb009_12010 [Planctomycetaceae bacterium]
MNALRLAFAATCVAVFTASDFGNSQCQAATNYSVQVQTRYWYSPAYPDAYSEHWETIETFNDKKVAWRVRNNLEYLMKTDYWKLYSIMQEIYDFPANAQFISFRVVEWEYNPIEPLPYLISP